jgi:hypothetical protein
MFWMDSMFEASSCIVCGEKFAEMGDGKCFDCDEVEYAHVLRSGGVQNMVQSAMSSFARPTEIKHESAEYISICQKYLGTQR